jgi:hypothetical protein
MQVYKNAPIIWSRGFCELHSALAMLAGSPTARANRKTTTSIYRSLDKPDCLVYAPTFFDFVHFWSQP